jgi:integrase/recombinase XerD
MTLAPRVSALPATVPDGVVGSINAWLAEVGQRSGSTRTPEEYLRYLGRFLKLVPDPREATTVHCHAFAYAIGASGKEPSAGTVNTRLAALRSWFDFLRRMGGVQVNPVDDVKRPKLQPPEPRGLDVDDLRRLLEAVPTKPAGLRDRAAIITFVMTGLRRSEVMGMRRQDLTVNGAVYYSVQVKGGAQRRRELPAPAFTAICEALESLGTPLESLAPDARLFPISSQGFYLNLRRYARKAGLEGLKPHDLRHSAAKLRRDTGASLEDVSGFLGHQNLATTARYLKRLEGEQDDGWRGAATALGI